MSATVDELLQAIKPLIHERRGDMQVCLLQPNGLEGLTFVELRSERAGLVDLYSGTVQSVLDVTALSHRLAYMRQRGGKDWALLIFHPDHGAENLVAIETDGESLILVTDHMERFHAQSRRQGHARS